RRAAERHLRANVNSLAVAKGNDELVSLDHHRPGAGGLRLRVDLCERFRRRRRNRGNPPWYSVGDRSDRHAYGHLRDPAFPGKLIVYGSVGGLIEMIIVGAIVGAIYKPSAPSFPSGPS